MKRTLTVFAALVAIAALVVAQTSAPPPQGGKGKGFKKVGGEGNRGVFGAKGHGMIRIQGSGGLMIDGTGTLILRGADAKNYRTEGFGKKREEGNATIFEGKGTLKVKAKTYSVEFTGKVDRLVAKGKGTAWFKGKGSYRIKGKDGAWAANGAEVQYDSAGSETGAG